jgi:hypothetical protein
MMSLVPKGAKCEEASTLSKSTYIPCCRPAVTVIKNGDRRPYYMCAPCADHNVYNRGAVVLTKLTVNQKAQLKIALPYDQKIAPRFADKDILTARLTESVKVAKSGKKPKTTVAILGVGVECRMDAEGEYVLPASAAECADLLYKARERRLSMQRETERVEKLEKQLQAWFVETLPASQTGVAGRLARVQIETKAVPQVEDWGLFYAHVKRTGSFELLQRRLSETAVKERWDDKKIVPGVTIFHAKKVSCTRI